MRKKCILFLLVFFTTSFSLLLAQSIIVKGKISDNTGTSLPGVNVIVKGTSNGTSTDFDGNYQISANQGDIIVFSSLGFKTKEFTISSNTLNVTLDEDSSQLDEVVVTALGINREKKSLGYAIQELKSEDLVSNPETNIVNALAGKVPGAQISNLGGAPGQGARITIRGVNSLRPGTDNQPLFIVDGLPISNDQLTVGGGTNRAATNRASDLNLEDVENLTVLKGAAATALYGVRAANGAIVITTKRGKNGKTTFSVSATSSIDRVNKVPKTQKKYTQGYNGAYDPDSFWPAWGSTVEDAIASDPTHPQSLFNNYENAYKTGFNNKVHFSASGGNEKSTFYTSFGRTAQEGILPFSDFKKTNAKISGDIKISDKVKINGSVNYTNSGGYRVNPDRFNTRLVYWAPRVDVNDYEFTEGPLAGTMKGYRSGGSVGYNPIYGNKVNRYKDNVDRFISNLGFNIAFTENFNLTYRFGMDYYSDARTATGIGRTGIEGENYFGDNGSGFITETRIISRDLNSNLMLSFQKDLTEKINFTLRGGLDILDENYDRVTTSGSELEVYNLLHLSNASLIETSQYFSKMRTIGLYGELSLSYDNYLFLTITDRNDWASTLPKENRSFNYPSVSLGYLLSENFELPKWVNYAKVRGSWAKIGKDSREPYLTSDVYRANASSFPIEAVTGWTRPNNKADLNLKPESTTEIEFGAEFKLFDNRLGIDFAWYKSNAKDQILSVPISYTSGYNTFTTNAGEIENRGIELSLNAVPLKTEDFEWGVNINFSKNRNKVVSIKEGIESIFLGSDFGYVGSSASQFLYAGYTYGNIFGRSYQRYYENPDDEDPLILDRSRPLLIGDDGFPIINTQQKILGNSTPDWLMNIGSNITYKNFNLSFNFDFRQGFEKYNSLGNFHAAFGLADYTENRDQTIVFEGVTADGSPNTKPVFLGQGTGPDGVDYGAGYYRNYHRRSTENFVEDASWIRLRNLSLTYNLPKSILEKTLISNASISASGSNLWLKTKYSGFDPESSVAQGNAEGFGGRGAYPGVKSYALSLRLTF